MDALPLTPATPRSRYRLAEFTLDPATRELRRNGTPDHLEPKIFDLIVYLVEQRSRVVPAEELLAVLWADAVVCRGALGQAVFCARKALSDPATRPRFIKTVHRLGYRFIGDVEEQAIESSLVTSSHTFS